MQAGDKVYVVSSGSYGAHYTPGTVKNVTPKGFVDVYTWNEKHVTRYRADGTQTGDSSKYWLDKIPYAERTERLNLEHRTNKARNALKDVGVSINSLWHLTKGDLLRYEEQIVTQLKQAQFLISII